MCSISYKFTIVGGREIELTGEEAQSLLALLLKAPIQRSPLLPNPIYPLRDPDAPATYWKDVVPPLR